MEQGEAPQAPVHAAPVLLREAREAAGMHIAALAAALKVPVRKLEALEEGRYDELPDLTFARALASSACRTLKIDSAPILAEIPVGSLPDLGDSPQTINAPFKSPEDGPSLSLGAVFSKPVVLGVLALMAATAGLLFVPSVTEIEWKEWVGSLGVSTEAVGEDGTVIESVSSSDSAAGQDVPMSPIAPSLQSASEIATAVTTPEDSPSEVASPDETSGGTVESAADGDGDQGTQDNQPVDATAGSPLLQVSAVGETWIEVINGSGAVVVQRVLREGDVLSFSSSPPYSVVIGNAAAAEVEVRGEPFDTSSYARNRVARFKVK
ncbi:hypothetical protein NBRC116584_10170 [Hydrogenophaga sp. 5NK40-0174]